MTPHFQAWLFDRSGVLKCVRAGALDPYDAEGLADELRHAGRAATLRLRLSPPGMDAAVKVPAELSRLAGQGYRVEIVAD